MVTGSCAPATTSVGAVIEAEAGPQVHVADRAAARRVALRVDAEHHLGEHGQPSGIALSESGREPAPEQRPGDGRHAVLQHGLGARLPGFGWGQARRGGHQDEAGDLAGMPDREVLGRHAAKRQADHMGLLDPERVEQAREIVAQHIDRDGRVAGRGTAMAARVVADQAVAARQRPRLRVPHLQGGPEEFENTTGRRPGGSRSRRRNRGPVDVDQRHGAALGIGDFDGALTGPSASWMGWAAARARSTKRPAASHGRRWVGVQRTRG